MNTIATTCHVTVMPHDNMTRNVVTCDRHGEIGSFTSPEPAINKASRHQAENVRRRARTPGVRAAMAI